MVCDSFESKSRDFERASVSFLSLEAIQKQKALRRRPEEVCPKQQTKAF